MPALVIASYWGHTTVVELLLKVPGVDVNLQDPTVAPHCPFLISAFCADNHLLFVVQDGTSALIAACREGHSDTVKALLSDVRVDVNMKNKVCRHDATIHLCYNSLLLGAGWMDSADGSQRCWPHHRCAEPVDGQQSASGQSRVHLGCHERPPRCCSSSFG